MARSYVDTVYIDITPVMLRLSTFFAIKKTVAAKKPYHHVNLKQNLLDSAVDLIGEVGPQAFTLREMARRAGVSHNAPYRHFRDKDDLLAAVAAQGFDRLTELMKKAMVKGRTAAERLSLAGRAYVQFALQSPQHLLAMFEMPVPDLAQAGQRPEHAEAAQRAFQTLLDAIAAVQAEGGLPKGDPLDFAVVAWSGVHGLAKLAIGGRLPFDAKRTPRFADYLTKVLAKGMATVPTIRGGRRRG